MHSTAANQPSQFKRNWRTLRLFNLFRIIVAASLLAITFFIPTTDAIAQQNKGFQAVTLALLLFSICSAFAIRYRTPRFGTQVYVYAIVDIIAITALTHTLSSSDGSLEILLITTIAGTALLLPERGAIIIASIASLALLGERSYTQLFDHINVNYTQAGLLGATFFLTAMLTTALNRRLKESELLAEQRGIDLANLAQLNEHVIQLLQSGIIVIDAKQRIHLINLAAQKLLGNTLSGATLEKLAPELTPLLDQWRLTQRQPANHLISPYNQQELVVHFSQIGNSPEQGAIIFLDDSALLAQQAQHIKLASLGRLTASIAHEVRNPLGAISHAAQLLEESPKLEASDLRLIEIIDNHASRVNTIIESILQLSRRERPNPSIIELDEWIDEFVWELIDSKQICRDDINIQINADEPTIEMDPTHLYQVINNLCGNAIRHSLPNQEQPRVTLRIDTPTDAELVTLEIHDNGPGIDKNQAHDIFEPFYTTESSGTGLGLYIARELCESNNAKLELVNHGLGACFRITFNHPKPK